MRAGERVKRAQREKWGAPVPDGLVHGTQTWVSRVYGCDCSKCLPSGKRRGPGTPQSIRQKKSRQNLRGKPIPPGTKHGIYTYRFYGCRCEICSAARAAQAHRHRHRWMYSDTRGHWTEVDGVTTLHWPPKNAGPDWVCPACGEDVAS